MKKPENSTHRRSKEWSRSNRANAVLAAAGYNFGLLLSWFEALLRAMFAALLRTELAPQNV